MKKSFLFVVLASVVLFSSGCYSLKYETTTKDGRKIQASSRGILTTRSVKQFKYNDVNGTLEVESSDSSPDRETIVKIAESISGLAELLK